MPEKPVSPVSPNCEVSIDSKWYVLLLAVTGIGIVAIAIYTLAVYSLEPSLFWMMVVIFVIGIVVSIIGILIGIKYISKTEKNPFQVKQIELEED
jgi:hypothetical protein